MTIRNFTKLVRRFFRLETRRKRRPFTPEHRAKISASLKRYHEARREGGAG